MGPSVVVSTEWQLAERIAVSEIARVGHLELGPDVWFQRGGQPGDVGAAKVLGPQRRVVPFGPQQRF